MFGNEHHEQIEVRTSSNDSSDVMSSKASNQCVRSYVTKVAFVIAAAALTLTCIYFSVNFTRSKQALSESQSSEKCSFEDLGAASLCKQSYDFLYPVNRVEHSVSFAAFSSCQDECRKISESCNGMNFNFATGSCEVLSGVIQKVDSEDFKSHCFVRTCHDNDGLVHNNLRLSLQTDTGKSSGSDPQVYTSINVWQSAAGTTDRITQKPDAMFGPDFEFEGPTLEISSVTGQTIEGFGGAFTEASALVYKKMSSQQQLQFIEDYFGEQGLGYILGRTHINSCDFSTGNYAFDDTDGDIQLIEFDATLNRDQQALIPLIKAAKSKLEEQQKELKLLATPWSPPAWMKTNGMMDHSDRPCIKDGLQDVWARYMSKWISSYEANGINIWAITVQNEPENNATWEGCLMTAEEEANFVSQFLGPELRTSHPEIKIYAFDHNKDHVYDWANTILSDEQAKQYISGVAYHWYTGDSFDNLQKVRAAFPDTPLLATEATWEAYRWKPGTTLATGDWSFGEGYAHDIIGDINSGSTGWIDWNLLLDEVGGPNHVNNVCDSAIQMDTKKGEVYKHPQYYYIGHFSRFVLPGSVQLATNVVNSKTYSGPTRPYGTCTDDDGLQAAAFRRPDDKIVLVALNCGSTPIDFKLSLTDQAVKLRLPPHSIQTYMM